MTNTENTLDIVEEYLKKVQEIWNSHKDVSLAGQLYEIRDYLKKEALLFISLNPSGEAKVENNQIKILNIYNYTYKALGKNGISTSNDEKPEGKNQKISCEKFFKKMNDISCYADNSAMAHLDLLFVNERTQTTIIKAMANERFKDFAKEQLLLSVDMMRAVEPKAIIVCNTLARDLLMKCFPRKYDQFDPMEKVEDYHFYDCLKEEIFEIEPQGYIQFDNRIGTYRIYGIRKENDKGIPIFFCGTFSGRRPIDKGTYALLKWHVCQVMKYEEEIGKNKK